MTAPKELSKLVKRFEDNYKQYSSPKYKEDQLRNEFLNPFFILLGWDVYNKKGRPPQYKEVVHEPSVEIEGGTEAPDYAFRLGEATKFYVEAKKPAVNITGNWKPAFQLRRYAWSAKLPLSILTNFEDISVYDCRVRPDKQDKPHKARIMHFTFQDIEERWNELASVFSKESLWEGSFDRYIEDKKKMKGTSQVDDEILKEIEGWREEIAKNIALRNPDLDIDELNFAVQRLIDRILFLRICEDRGTEPEKQLKKIYEKRDDLYKHLFVVFQQADAKYNSGLFHFTHDKSRSTRPDRVTPYIKIDDNVLASIIWDLYYPNSPYQFDVIPADILGQVYEQFLGKVIRLTAGHRAKIEEKPEVKKAGGVYYTPTYIVDYIVENTVGKLCEGKSPEEMKELRILDPACGSGSFLIVAYKRILDEHLKWYEANNPKKYKDSVFEKKKDEWQLRLQEKKRILLNNIYGVDIDRQAVEVTKLNLLLKALEGESKESIDNVQKWFREPALPDLGSNIKCGNSLIDHDIGEHLKSLTEEEHDTELDRINPFSWLGEFPEIMKAGGFDTVVGNPPYGASLSDNELEYLSTQNPYASKFPDSYCQFMMRAVELKQKNGFVSFIVPNTFCDLESCDDFRKWFLTSTQLLSIWQSGWAFKTAVVDTLVFVVQKDSLVNDIIEVYVDEKNHKRTISSFLANELTKIDYRNSEEDKKILIKMVKNTKLLRDIAVVKAGVKLYEKGKGKPQQSSDTLKQRPYTRKAKCPTNWRPLYRGGDVTRYSLANPEEYVNYGPWLAAPRSPELFKSPKILMRRTDDRLMSTLENSSAICVNSCHVIKLKESIDSPLNYLYILGLLNSRLLQLVFELSNPQMVNKVFAEIKVIYVERLPIHTIDFSDPKDKAGHDKMVKLVERMLKLHKDLKEASTPDKEEKIQRRIDATDREINNLVYELYGLTEEEIKIVEEESHE